jgi:hypothetical protein
MARAMYGYVLVVLSGVGTGHHMTTGPDNQ